MPSTKEIHHITEDGYYWMLTRRRYGRCWWKEIVWTTGQSAKNGQVKRMHGDGDRWINVIDRSRFIGPIQCKVTQIEGREVI